MIYFTFGFLSLSALSYSMEKIKTALLAYGMSGKVFHAPFLDLHDGFELAGAWERTKKLVEKDFPNAKSYASLEAILNDELIDLVIVNTPGSTHFEFAKKALLAGKHVVVEKAFTSSVDQADELIAIANEKNLKLVVFQNRRWDSDFKTVMQVVNQKYLGDIVEAEFHFDRYNPAISPKIHKEMNHPAAGVLMDLGSHIIDQALFLFGMPLSLFADIRHTREFSVVDDWFDITLFYKNFRVRLKSSFFVREPAPSYIIHGTKGSFLKHRGDVQEDEAKQGKKPSATDWGTESKEKYGILHTIIDNQVSKVTVTSLKGNYFDFFEGLHQCIAYNKPEPVAAADGRNVIYIIEKARESCLKKMVVTL
jgi:scyllo-inositol 2-dehydrogenase (NADP+)